MNAILNLDKDFRPFGDKHLEIPIKLLKFSGGEIHVNLGMDSDALNDYEDIYITHRVNSSDNLMEVMLAKDALRREFYGDIHLFIPYLPYARQDRVCSPGDAFSARVFAEIINSAGFTSVACLDAHSSVSTELIYNCFSIKNTSYVEEALDELVGEGLVLVSPDAGAQKKSQQLFLETRFNALVQCEKKRNPETGELSGFNVLAEDLNGHDCIIVDDICDGGGTFIGLAKELKAKGAGDLYLFVTHGIFSKGTNELLHYYEHIFTTDSIQSPVDGMNVTQLKISI